VKAFVKNYLLNPSMDLRPLVFAVGTVLTIGGYSLYRTSKKHKEQDDFRRSSEVPIMVERRQTVAVHSPPKTEEPPRRLQ
jgi:hypothetical protein